MTTKQLPDGWIIEGPIAYKPGEYPQGVPVVFWPVASQKDVGIMKALIEARSRWHQCWVIPSAPRMA